MRLTGLIVPAALIAALVAAFLAWQPFSSITGDVPPVEELAVELTRLDASGIHVSVRAAGSLPMEVAQVQVDGAYRTFTIEPEGPIGYLGTAAVHIPYPWVTGDTHHLNIVTATGTTFEHEIAVAIATPETGGTTILTLLLIGLFVGIIPVAIGFAFYPAIQSFGEAGRNFAMALTLGLLLFLLVDTMGEALEVAEAAVGGLKADLLVWMSAAVTCLGLLAWGRRSGEPPRGAELALFIAIGIGIHNLGEGLVIGASIATGEVALASFLVLGFALHNVTEGIAISAPMRKERLTLLTLFWLALIAGGPAMLGTLAGAYATTPLWTALAFGIGAGAITQVVIEVGGLLWRTGADGAPQWRSAASMSGFVCGVAVMYVTAFIVHG